MSFATLAEFSQQLRRLPRVVANKVAENAAPEITRLAKQTFGAGANAYGETWAPGADGQQVTLRKSGKLADQIEYVAIGTKIRVKLGVSYAKYQIGRRPVFPTQGGLLPAAYVQVLQRVSADTVRAEMRGGS